MLATISDCRPDDGGRTRCLRLLPGPRQAAKPLPIQPGLTKHLLPVDIVTATTVSLIQILPHPVRAKWLTWEWRGGVMM